MEVIIIAAVSKNMVIGKDNTIPWHLPSDLQHFKRSTLGHPMIMGRKTWESFGSRPLPKRPHIVLSRVEMTFEYDNVEHAFDIESAILKARAAVPDKNIYVIGGALVYSQVMASKLADRMIISHVDAEIEGDHYFPEIGKEWKNLSVVHVASDNIPYTITEYAKVRYPDDADV